MLSQYYLRNFKEQYTLPDYLEQQKELTLPRFKLVKELGRDVSTINHHFVPFIKERDQMNKLKTPKININISSSSQSQKALNIKLDNSNISHSPDSHWQYHQNFIYYQKRSKSKIQHNISPYKPRIIDSNEINTSYQLPKQSEPIIPTVKKYYVKLPKYITKNIKNKVKKNHNHTTTEKSPPQQQKSNQQKLDQLPNKVIQPYLDEVSHIVKDDLFFKLDTSYHVSNDFHEKCIHLKQRAQKLLRKIRQEYTYPDSRDDLLNMAEFLLQKKD